MNQDIQTTVDIVASRMKKEGSPVFELVVQRSVHWEVEANKGEIDRYQHADITEAAIRILKDGRQGFCYTSCLSPEHLENWLDTAIQGAAYAYADPDIQFAPPAAGSLPSLDIFDESLVSMKDEDRVEQALLLEEGAYQSDPRVKKVRRASYYETHQWTSLVNSLGLDLSARMTLVEGALEAVAEEGEESQAAWESDFSNFFNKLKMNEIGARAGKRAASLLGGRRARTMKVPAVIANFAAVDLLGILAPSFLADNLHKGKSILKGKLGKKLFPEHLQIVDDGLYPGGLATFPFDGEGSPHQRTEVVTSGTVQRVLYDLKDARRDGKETTGNSVRDSLKVPPRAGISNFLILPSRLSRDSLMVMAPSGVMISGFLGTHLADPISGDFSLGVIGHWFEEGNLQYPLQEMVISGNIVSLFQQVAEAGNDFRLVDQLGSPSLLIEEVEVSGS